MEYKNLLNEIRERILLITINRESKLNALNKETLDELHACITDAFSDTSVGGIIITGTGRKAFVAGADIGEFVGLSPVEASEMSRNGHDKVFNAIERGNKPVVAAINGYALGGGLELAMACHLRIASENAKMGLPEVSLGIIPGYGGTQRLTQLVGRGKALEMILSAGMLDAAEAFRVGLVNRVVKQEQLLQTSASILTNILNQAPLALAAAIKAVNALTEDGVNGFGTEIEEFGKCFATDDFKEGVNAFLQKRTAKFSGN